MKNRPAPSTSHPLAAALLRGAAPAALITVLSLAGACAGTESPDSPPGTAERATAAPLNSSPEASMPAPEPQEAPPAPYVEPRSEWSLDESIDTPQELRGLELLAKFKKEDGRVVIIYRAKNGDVYRRISGAMGAYTRVEESRIEIDP